MIEAIFVADSEYSKVKLKQLEKLQCLIPKTLPTPSCEKIVLPGKYEVVPNHDVKITQSYCHNFAKIP